MRVFWIRFATFHALALAITPCALKAQEFDTVTTVRNRRPFTVIDQVADAQERAAFASLYQKLDAKEKARLAEAFLLRYPQSWLLAQVHEIAAKAYIDLDDLDRALNHGKKSLRLLPENPLLSVPLANVLVQKSLLVEARQMAMEALDQLTRFVGPVSCSTQQWAEIGQDLKASSLFVLGRVAMTEALSPAAGSRSSLLLDAEKFLLEAQSLNPSDPEIAYLLGLTYLSRGEAEKAGTEFAMVYHTKGVLQSQAEEQLRKLHASDPRGSQSSFETFLQNCLKRRQEILSSGLSLQRRSSLSPGVQRFSSEAVPGNSNGQLRSSLYAGSQACSSCHPSQFENWQHSGMARMFQPYRPENVIGDFSRQEPFFAGDQVHLKGDQLEIIEGKDRFPYAQMYAEKGQHYFRIRHASGSWVRYPVSYTIGSKWQQAYATRLPNGQIHVFPVQYNRLHKRWLNFWKVIDLEDSERADVRTFEKPSAATNYQANCAVCHTSQLVNTAGDGFDTDHMEFLEPGINCEMCHGPSAGHVRAMQEGKTYLKEPLDPPVDFQRIGAKSYVAICAQCHMQSAVREAGLHGALNFSGNTRDFAPANKNRPFAEFSRKAFYRDGRFRETTFIVESLQRSSCYKKGEVTCGHCHDPHGPGAESNPKSLKFLTHPDQMCLQCHEKFADRPEQHTRHPSSSEASRCVSCHMPRIMNSLLFKARTHQIDEIPEGEQTQRFGQDESPNACLLCHADNTAQWALSELQNWRRNH